MRDRGLHAPELAEDRVALADEPRARSRSRPSWRAATPSGCSVTASATGLPSTCSRISSQRRIASGTGVGPKTAAEARQHSASNSSRWSPARRACVGGAPPRVVGGARLALGPLGPGAQAPGPALADVVAAGREHGLRRVGDPPHVLHARCRRRTASRTNSRSTRARASSAASPDGVGAAPPPRRGRGRRRRAGRRRTARRRAAAGARGARRPPAPGAPPPAPAAGRRRAGRRAASAVPRRARQAARRLARQRPLALARGPQLDAGAVGAARGGSRRSRPGASGRCAESSARRARAARRGAASAGPRRPPRGSARGRSGTRPRRPARCGRGG